MSFEISNDDGFNFHANRVFKMSAATDRHERGDARSVGAPARSQPTLGDRARLRLRFVRCTDGGRQWCARQLQADDEGDDRD